MKLEISPDLALQGGSLGQSSVHTYSVVLGSSTTTTSSRRVSPGELGPLKQVVVRTTYSRSWPFLFLFFLS